MSKIQKLIKYTADTLGTINSLDRRMLPVIVVKSLFVCSVPFVVIILSAEIINKLSNGGGFEETLLFALASVALIFVLTVIGGYFTKVRTVRQNLCARLNDFAKNNKAMEMDYAELENPAINSLRMKLRAQEGQGYSFPLLLTIVDKLSDDIFTSLLAFIVLIPVLVSAESLPFMGILIFLAVSVILSVAAAALSANSDRKVNEMIIDDDLWPDCVIESEVMSFSDVFTYKRGKDIRVYGFGKHIKKRYRDFLKFILTTTRKFGLIPGFVFGVVSGLRVLILGGSFAFVAIFIRGDYAFGDVLLLAGLLYNFTLGISQAISRSSLFLTLAGVIQMYLDFIKVPDTLYKGSIPTEKRDDNEYEIEFKNVSFKYPGSEAYALKNLNLKLTISKRLAIVGMNGSGKTTMIKLLCRLYDPTEGEILLNGVNIMKYDLQEYQNIFSVVFQDFKLFSMKLGQVLASSVEYESERARECLNKSGLSERLAEMPCGLETPLYKDYDDGVDVSGGEAQKIAIARALYKDAPFIILDEPTAALDPISEFEVYSGFDKIIQDKTAIFISHRLSSCRFCDDIAVFHEGELIERGSHDELVSIKTGKYFELWNAQAQYYVV